MTVGEWPLAYTVNGPDCRSQAKFGYHAPFAEAVRAISAAGYDGIEFQVRDPASLDFGGLRAGLDDLGLGVAAVGTGPVAGEDGLTLADPDPERAAGALRRLRDALAVATAFGAPVTIGSVRGLLPAEDHDAREAVRSRVLTAVRTLADEAARCGTVVLLEPQCHEVTNFLTTAEACAGFIVDSGSPAGAGMVLDLHHQRVERGSLAADLAAHAELVRHVQLADTGRLPLGDGEEDVAAVSATLRDAGYRGWLTAEHAQAPGSALAAAKTRETLVRTALTS